MPVPTNASAPIAIRSLTSAMPARSRSRTLAGRAPGRLLGAQRLGGVGAEEVQAAELDAQRAGAHVLPDEHGERVARPKAAVRALQVGELDERDGRVLPAERRPVLRDSGKEGQ